MKTFQKAPIALAVTALMMAPVAFASSDNNSGGGFTGSSTITSDFMNNIEVDLKHVSDTYKRFRVNLNVNDSPSHYSGALVDSKQFTDHNKVDNIEADNDARVGSGTGTNATGNVGINVAAGENNAQANDAALAASDAMDVFGQSEAFSAQHARGNVVTNTASTNNAVLGSASLQNASGNIGANVAAGTSNAQQNSLAASSNEKAGHTRATTGGVQQTSHNTTTNTPQTELGEGVTVSLNGSLSGTFENPDGVTYDGDWRQTNDVYPEIWSTDDSSTNHGQGSYWGHADFDDQGDAGQDGRFEGTEDGNLDFTEAGDITLSGTLSGDVMTTTIINADTDNNARVGSNALRGASGNIGINVAAGSNNLQRNSLSIASSMGGSSNIPE